MSFNFKTIEIMTKLITCSREEVMKMVHVRDGEEKLGSRVLHIKSPESWAEELKNQKSRYVIFGIAEDIGVRANFGRAGTASAWENFLKIFVNIQHNHFCKGDWITLLGELDLSHEMKSAENLNPYFVEEREELSRLVSRIDIGVHEITETIIRLGKIPIIIGGGHNNAYGNLKGLSIAKGESVDAVNLDAHADFRPMEGRHSGNGFSYAMKEGFLNHYFIFGLHENYLSTGIIGEIDKFPGRVRFNTYEEIAVRQEKSFKDELQTAGNHLGDKPFGLEMDLDAIPLIASSAITPSGFSAEQARRFVHHFASKPNVAYLHLCEGAPVLSSDKNPNLVGKLIAYLVTDFIKSNRENEK